MLTSRGVMAGVLAVSPEQVTTTSASSTTASSCSVTARFPFSTFRSLEWVLYLHVVGIVDMVDVVLYVKVDMVHMVKIW